MQLFNKMKVYEVSEIEETKQKVIYLLNKAKKYVWMSTGLNSGFYNDKNVRHALENALGSVTQFRLLIDDDIEKRKEELSWLFDEIKEKGFRIRQRKETPHWIIVDGRHFRLEKPHPPKAVGTDNVFITDIEFALSEVIQYSFEEWWANASLIK